MGPMDGFMYVSSVVFTYTWMVWFLYSELVGKFGKYTSPIDGTVWGLRHKKKQAIRIGGVEKI